MSGGIETAAYRLSGLRLDDGWEVLNRLPLPEQHTGGAFSVGYLVRSPSGRMGFLKALDYAAALKDIDPPRALEELTSAYNAERDLLAICGTRKLSRIVRSLGAGTVNVQGVLPGAVSYIIFELADGDARDALAAADPVDHLPKIRLAHHAAVGISQLHGIHVAHQDVKPSNVVVTETTDGPSGKLSDLGSAHVEGRPSPNDDLWIAGDPSYATPEQLYQREDTMSSPRRRYAADMYMLGNLLCFLLTGVSYKGIFYRMYLDCSQHWAQWTGSFDAVLPGLIDSHGLTIHRIRSDLHSDIAEAIAQALDELCYPDMHHRGDPVARRLGQNPFALHRYITRLDLLHRRAALQPT